MTTGSSSARVYIADGVLGEIDAAIASHPPERGGALLGPRGSSILSELIPDPEARTSAASYEPSDALRRRVLEREADTGVSVLSIVHSHPGGLDRPSGPDEEEMRKALASNPRLQRFLAPIVTGGSGRRSLRPHELALAHGKVSVYAARPAVGGIEVGPVPVTVMPVAQSVGRVGEELGLSGPIELGAAEIDERQLLQATLQLTGGAQLSFLLSEHYPAIAPIVLFADSQGELDEIPIEWSLTIEPGERLLTAIEPELEAIASGDATAIARQDEASRTAAKLPRSTRRRLNKALDSRLGRSLGRSMRRRHVLLVGAGSVGSAIGETLVRSGIGKVTIVDPDEVSLANLARPSYAFADVGKRKALAAAELLQGVNPGLEVEPRDTSLQELPRADAYELVARADLVLAATDDPEAQVLAGHLAYHAGVPAIFPALYREALGGEVLVQVPERTACYLCATAVHGAGGGEDVRGGLDYGTRRLEAQVAVPPDIQQVAAAAAKLALSLLLDGKAQVGDFLAPQLESGETYLTMSMSPSFWFFDRLLDGVPGQYAYAAAWLAPERDPHCAICGPARLRTDPRTAKREGPSAASLQAAARRRSRPGNSAPSRPRAARAAAAVFQASRPMMKKWTRR